MVDDESSIRRTLREILEFEDFEVTEASNGLDGISQLKKATFDVILLDIRMPRMDGLEALERIQLLSPDTPVVMISGHGTIDTAVEAVKKGAFDFISKPPDLNRLLITLRNAMDRSNLVTETKALKRKVSSRPAPEMIGQSPAIQHIKKTIERVAPTEARVLITGPNGSGKELVAQWIHRNSQRAGQPLIEINCAAIPTELIESELFGHEKGAFTSAHKQHIGKFEQANGGILFLDEIGDMSASAQAKVLRALQDKRIVRVGGDKALPIDVRVIAATNKDLRQAIQNGNFREDLYHRLAVIIMDVPPLDDRREDIPLLVEHFNRQICEDYGIAAKVFEPEAKELLMQMHWSGNIRELRNVVERLIILGDQTITLRNVRQYAPGVTPANTFPLRRLFQQFDNLEELQAYIGKHYESHLRRTPQTS